MFGSLGLGLGLGAQSRAAQKDMILVYAIPSAGTTIQLAIQANSTYFSAGQSVVIDWGDGSANDAVSNTGGSTYIGHTYASAGTYTVKISGSMKMYGRIWSNMLSGQELLTHIHSFGKLGITSLACAFWDCTGLVSVPKTLPDSVTSMQDMFRNCYGDGFNPDVSKWDVSEVRIMSGMFSGCYGAVFNPDVSNWNVSKVTVMHYMFNNCRGDAFNPDVSGWDVSNVENMLYMFSGCKGAAFNPNVTNWNVSKVTNMSSMFSNCYGDAFRGGRGVGGVGIAKWRLKLGNNAVLMVYFMSSSKIQDPPFLDDILNAWAALHAQGLLPTNITVDFGNNKYTAAGNTAYTTLSTITDSGGAGWTILCGGLQS